MAGSQKRQPDELWCQRYADRLYTPEQALDRLRSGQCVFIAGGAACPKRLLQALVSRAESLADMELVQLFATTGARTFWPKLSGSFRILRLLVEDGANQCIPTGLYDLAQALERGRLTLDAALITVTPPDRQGWCSLGCQVALEKAAAANASLVIAEVNPALPWTEGDSLINFNDIDLLVESDLPLEVRETEQANNTIEQLGRQMASLVEDGSVLSPDSDPICFQALRALRGKRQLRIHTEVVSDEIMDLLEGGVVVQNRSGAPAVTTCSAFGSERFYNYLHQSRNFSFQPISFVCRPAVLERLESLVAISVVEQIDLTGQAALGPAGVGSRGWLGSRLDFHRAARRSSRGKSILLLPALSSSAGRSQIVFRLDGFRAIAFTRDQTQYVVTEFGVAYLAGKDLEERALSLISIAHPNYRAELLRQAVAGGLVRPELSRLEGSLHHLPIGLPSLKLLDDGTAVTFRPVMPTDEGLIKSLFYSLSQQSIYNRWMSSLKKLPEAELQSHLLIDHRNQVALVGTLPAAEGEEIVAVGGYMIEPNGNRAEVALVVRDGWQRRGVGTFLLRLLIQIARRNGITGFSAEVLVQNTAMQRVFNEKSGCRVTSRHQEGTLHFELDFV